MTGTAASVCSSDGRRTAPWSRDCEWSATRTLAMARWSATFQIMAFLFFLFVIFFFSEQYYAAAHGLRLEIPLIFV
jgi:hypothetical protein